MRLIPRWSASLWLLACTTAFASWPSPCWSASYWPSQYDRQIEAAAGRWLPGWPWRLWKAELYAESRLDPDARSPVGAVGLAQFMPATWAEITRAMGMVGVDRRMAGPAIEAGAFYLARLARSWSSPRPWADRAKLGQSSYNAGLGNILKAQRLCDGAILYDDIIVCLPRVTGAHSRETTSYVVRIWRYWHEMEVAR